MIIWINGAFGSGKTQTAYELKRRLKDSHVFDPEEIGFFIGKRVPKDQGLVDFQDYSIWREVTTTFLNYISNKNKVIIVPMTVVNKDYLNEIIEPLKKSHEIKHFTLMASKEIIEKRLLKRGDRKKDWTFKQVDRCLTLLNNSYFSEHINTGNLNICEVVNLIASKLDLELTEDKASAFTKKLYRLKVQLKHIRF